MPDDMRRRAIRPGELLAIRPDFVHEDRGAFFWLFAPAVSQNDRIGSVSVVRINGPLEYHDDGWGESYESIVCRVEKAMSGQDAVERHRREHRWDGDYQAIDATPAKCVVLRIDSPGGVVAGLDQTVRKLRSMARDSKIPIYAYVDETAYSAGYALCCGASEVYVPRSGFVGSIGVISTMVDQTSADRKAGYRFVVLTSGARKADGHPHVPITSDMIAEESPRVAALAKQFYATVKRARGVPINTIRGWEAKRFLGAEAARAGLVDGILSWDEFLSTLSAKYDAPANPDAPPQVAQSGTRVPYSTAEPKDMLAIDALIARKEAAIKSEKDPAKLAALFAEIEAAKKTKKMTEEEESSTKDEEEEASSAKKGKGDETDRNDDEDDDEDEEDDDDDAKKGKKSKKSSKKSAVETPPVATKDADTRIAAIARQITGKNDPGAVVAALEGMVAGIDAMQARLGSLETKQRKSDRNALVDSALASKRITPFEAKQLRTKKLEFVEQVIGMRPAGSALVDTEHPQFAPGAPPETALASLPESVRKQLDMAAAHAKAQGFKTFDPAKIAQEALAKTNGKAEV